MTDSVPIHGNYRGYYTKRPSFRDPRLAVIPKDVFNGARVLDVGCNEGWVTCEIARSLNARQVIGVDIDDGLVRAAWKHRRSVWSQHPLIHSTSSPGCTQNGITVPPSKKAKDKQSQISIPQKRRLEDEECRNKDDLITDPEEHEYAFPGAFDHMFGPLPIPPADTPEEQTRFPHNVIFRTTDWPNSGAIDDKDGYDVVLALSVTKWIHLNDGDEGLLKFFRHVFSVLRSGGVFIVEPQEWESYHKAKRLDPRLKKNGEALKLRPADFERELLQIGFRSVEHLGRTGKEVPTTGFLRALDLYRK